MVSLTVDNSALTDGSKTVSYTVMAGDSVTSIATGLKNAVNADSDLQSIGLGATSSAASSSGDAQHRNLLHSIHERWSNRDAHARTNDRGNVSAVDGSSNTETEGLQVSVKGPGTTSLTYDKNGNLTGDGTNSYKWDAANRMIEVDYPGSGNKSLFAYDGYGRNIQILEYSGGSLTSTKNFVWAQDKMRPYQACEARNVSGTISGQYFALGETTSGTSYFYTTDNLRSYNTHPGPSSVGLPMGFEFDPTARIGSIRELTDTAGSVVSQTAYDPAGRPVLISGTHPATFGFADYYLHQPSHLNLTRFRAYTADLAFWMSRDPLAEEHDSNQYAFCGNDPVSNYDPTGLYCCRNSPNPNSVGYLDWCVTQCQKCVQAPIINTPYAGTFLLGLRRQQCIIDCLNNLQPPSVPPDKGDWQLPLVNPPLGTTDPPYV